MPLARLSFATHKLVSLRISLGAQHVKGHSGDPWNELADSLCIFFKKTTSPVTGVPGGPFNRTIFSQVEFF